jgi:hypothetical protein
MDAPFLGIIGAYSTVLPLVGYSGGALEELSRGTRESFIKPTPWTTKSTLTQPYCDRSTMICGSNIPIGSSQMAILRCVILTRYA